MDEDGNAARKVGDGKVGAGLLPQDLRHNAARYSLQQVRDGIARRALDLARIVDDRLAEPVGQIGGQRQQAVGLVGIARSD